MSDMEDVGKSELDMEKELIALVSRAEQLEKKGSFQEAIQTLEQAKNMAEYQGGIDKKIAKIRKKMGSSGKSPSSASNSMEELDQALNDLAKGAEKDSEKKDASSLDNLWDNMKKDLPPGS